MLKMSKTSKLGTKSWSLQAVETCPGSVGADGNLVPACSGCYATTGMYHFGPVKAVRADNKADWKRDGWVADMVAALKRDTHFRWFDSGDVYSLELARKMLEIMRGTPWVKHWLPTRMAKFAKFKAILSEMDALPNVKVRFSSDSVTGDFNSDHGSVIFPADSDAPAGTVKCTAYENAGKCGNCRACYSKDIKVIAYPSHGRKMSKVIKIALAN